MAIFEGEETIRSYAELMLAVQAYDGKVVGKSLDPGLYRTRSANQIYADAALFAEIIKLTAEFGSSTKIVAFLVYVRPILLKWLDLRSSRSIELRQGNLSVTIQGDNDVDKALDVLRVRLRMLTDERYAGA